MLLLRYAVFVPVLLLLRAGIQRCKPQSKTHVQLAVALLIALPSIALALMMLVIRPTVEPCEVQSANPCTPQPASPPPPALPGYTSSTEEQCVSSVDGTDYCYYGGLPVDYVTVLGLAIHIGGARDGARPSDIY